MTGPGLRRVAMAEPLGWQATPRPGPKVRRLVAPTLLLVMLALSGCVSDEEVPERIVNCLFATSEPGQLEWHIRPGGSIPEEGYDWERANRTGLLIPVLGGTYPANTKMDDSREAVKVDPLPAQGCLLIRIIEPGWYQVTASAAMPNGGSCSWYPGDSAYVEVVPERVAQVEYGASLACT